MKPIPVLSLPDTVAFLRDPAVFTAGPGLEIGDVYRARVPGYRIFVVTDPVLVERILVREAEDFVKGKIYWRALRRTIGDSIGSLDGAQWSYLHAGQRPHFTPKAARAYAPALAEQIRRYLEGCGGSTPVLPWLAELNARLMLDVLCGCRDEPMAPEIVARLTDGHDIIAWLSKFPWRPATAHLTGVARRAALHERFFDNYVRRLVAARESRATEAPAAGSDPAADEAGGILLDALLRMQRDPEAPRYTESLVRNEIVFHLGASTETLAAAEGWALHLLWRHPRELERVRREIDDVSGDRAVESEDVPHLRRMHSVARETLRLYPPVYGIVRDSTRAFRLGDTRVRPGDTFLISVHGIHRNPRLWEEPGHFHPDRFPEGGSTDARGPERYHYLPFGAGTHVCTGRHVAIQALVLTLARCAQVFDWRFHEEDVRAVARPSLKPSGDFVATFTPRGSR